MKEIVLKVYKFDELSKDSQERIIERERWNVMEQCMDAYSIDYQESMKAFEDMTDTRVYGWEVGYERYDFSYEFKYKDPIYEHPTDYHRDIFPENLCGKLLFRYINNNIMPHITNIEVIRYRLPIYWACPLINDDYTGLTDEECKEIKRFLEAAEGYPVDVDLETQGFYQYNDAGTLPGECADFIFHKYND